MEAKYGVVVCTRETDTGLDFATREVANESEVHQALEDVFTSEFKKWKFIMVCYIEDMPLLMQGFEYTGTKEGELDS